MTTDNTVLAFHHPEHVDDPLTSVLRDGARRLLAQSIEAEAEAFLASLKEERLVDGRARVVRHGHGPGRAIQTGIGAVPVRRAKLRDRGAGEAGGERITFTSALLPKWARRTKSLEALLPVLHLRGISSGDFQEAPAALRDTLLAFFDFPADHWDHLRTADPIERVFAAVRHRTVRAKGALSQKTASIMVFKLVMAASKTWRRLKGQDQLPLLIEGVRFADGVAVTATSETNAA